MGQQDRSLDWAGWHAPLMWSNRRQGNYFTFGCNAVCECKQGEVEVIKSGPGQPTGAMDHGEWTVCPSYMIM